MKHLMNILLILSPFIIQANEPDYYKFLEKRLKATDSVYNKNNFQRLSNLCDRIIQATNDEWLPWYYKSYANTHLGFMASDEETKDHRLDIAQDALDSAMHIYPHESENYVLQALIYFGRMEINPMTRSMIYYPRAEAALNKAKEYNPQNPRIYYLEGQALLYKPSFLGGGKEAAKPVLAHSLKCFNTFDAPYEIYPSWGRKATSALYEKCAR